MNRPLGPTDETPALPMLIDIERSFLVGQFIELANAKETITVKMLIVLELRIELSFQRMFDVALLLT